MDWQAIKDEWPRLRNKARERWPRLNDSELERIRGNRTTLMEILQDRYDLSLEDAGVEADRWADTVSDHGDVENT